MAGFVTKIIKSGLGVFTSRIFGMVRDICIAGFFGANGATDAFVAAFAVPNLFRAFFAEGALASVFVPFLSDKLTMEGEQKASVYLSSLITVISSVVLILTVLVMAFPDIVTYIFLPGYKDDPAVSSLMPAMVSVLMPYLFFVTVCSLLTCYLNLKGSFFVPNSSTAFLNIAMIAGAFMGYHHGSDILYVCYGVFIGGVAQFFFILLYAYRFGFRFSLRGGYDRRVNEVFHYAVPSLAGVGISQINFMIGRAAASFLATGSISYLYYSNRLFQFPMGLFTIAVGTVVMAEISKANSSGDTAVRNSLIDKAINSIMLVMLPSAAGLIVLAEPIISLVYGRMNFLASDTAATAADLQMYSLGLVFYSFIAVFSRVFYSDKDIKTPLKGAFVGLVVNVVMIAALMKFMGHSGIALASSVAAAATFFYLYTRVRDYRYLFGAVFMKASASSAIMVIGSYIMLSAGAGTVVNIVISAVLYFLALYLMKTNIRSVLR